MKNRSSSAKTIKSGSRKSRRAPSERQRRDPHTLTPLLGEANTKRQLIPSPWEEMPSHLSASDWQRGLLWNEVRVRTVQWVHCVVTAWSIVTCNMHILTGLKIALERYPMGYRLHLPSQRCPLCRAVMVHVVEIGHPPRLFPGLGSESACLLHRFTTFERFIPEMCFKLQEFFLCLPFVLSVGKD